ncbi:unnamed protein product [Aphanomyces euteiches]|uniref:HIT-type domain-containing protein n=1 Tax=Aphanomyces euteiches TaxID=100861 RepID=A0A6G0WDG4_9STRA|nr:hypothetical protein Ae201684_016763 [Aphanomyces euteiches]KAH9082975.1 hypothetical protein Ae201684P_013878 [Aphanomyces euteiches]KAH9156055.1 hypothetical protein AeRB84_002041 [Aphanomyces euteiches]
MSTCGVCQEQPRKYKCPLCRLPYCSTACYKIHKETPCMPEVKTEVKEEPEAANPPDPSVEENDDDDDVPLLTKEQLAVLSKSEKIQKSLQDAQLRDRIKAIDQHPNRMAELQKALTDPVFARFVYGMMNEVYSVEKKA